MALCTLNLNLGVRHIQVCLMFLLLLLANAFRVNISLAIVAMIDPETSNAENYPWSESTKSLILSSFFWGYAASHLPAGNMARRFGPKVILGWGFAICSIFTALTYPMAHLGGWELTCAGRVLQGMSQGFIFPCCHQLISKWTPPAERGRVSSFVYSAANIGNVIMLLVSGIIAEHWGWPAIFYVCGVCGLLWVALWWYFGSNSPEEYHKKISEEEKNYIQSSIGQITDVEELKNLTTPWRSILTSVPFWATIATQCAQNYGFFTLLTQIPSYLSSVMDFDLKKNSLLSALPYLVLYIASVSFGYLSDLFRNKNMLSVTWSRKIFNSIGQYIPAASLIGLGFMSKDNPTMVMVLLCIAVGVNGGIYSGYIVNHLDLSPIYAGVLMGISNFLAQFSSILAPLIVGWVVTDAHDPTLWRIIFFITAGYYFIGNSLFVLFGTGKIQAWNFARLKPLDNEESRKKSIMSEKSL